MLSSDTPYEVTIDADKHVDIQVEKGGAKRHAEHEGITNTTWGLSNETKSAIEQEVRTDFKNSQPSRRFLRQLQQKEQLTVTTTLITTFIIWFFFELFIVPFGFGIEIASPLWEAIFVLSSDNILYIWTWVTNIFSHGGLIHLLVNSIVLGSFGYYVEGEVSSERFAKLFLLGGIVAGVSQAVAAFLFGTEVMHIVGASGGIAAVIGCASVIFPRIKIALFFFIPMQITTGVKLFLFGSIAIVVWFGIGAGQIAHIAHITGLLVGLGFGWRYKSNQTETADFIIPE